MFVLRDWKILKKAIKKVIKKVVAKTMEQGTLRVISDLNVMKIFGVVFEDKTIFYVFGQKSDLFLKYLNNPSQTYYIDRFDMFAAHLVIKLASSLALHRPINIIINHTFCKILFLSSRGPKSFFPLTPQNKIYNDPSLNLSFPYTVVNVKW